MTDATTATASEGGHHVIKETREMTDSLDITDSTTTTTNTAMLNSDASPATSHSEQKENNISKRDSGSSQELSSTRPQELISGQDTDLTINAQIIVEQSGTKLGCAETTPSLHLQSVGYKREHSHSPCSQNSPLHSPTSACRAIGCVVEPEQELVEVSESCSSGGGGGQGEEKETQPRKRVKRETTMEGGQGEGSNGRTRKWKLHFVIEFAWGWENAREYVEGIREN
jgi:hypothetical protein